MEFDVAANALTGGIPIASFYVVAGSGSIRQLTAANVRDQIRLSYDTLNSVGDVLSIVATSFTGTSNLNATLDWAEYY